MNIVILPAFNEEKSITNVCQDINKALKRAKLPFKILVVNDGSTDGTLKKLLSLQKDISIQILNHKQNKGLGAAIKTGFTHALKKIKINDAIITLDADNTHPASLITELIKKVESGSDVVVASRYQDESKTQGVPKHRIFLSNFSNILFKAMFPIQNINDYTSGFRAYKALALQKGFRKYGEDFISQSGFSCMADILIKLRLFNLKFSEVPLHLRYDLKTGRSKMKLVNNISETLKLILFRKLNFYA